MWEWDVRLEKPFLGILVICCHVTNTLKLSGLKRQFTITFHGPVVDQAQLGGPWGLGWLGLESSGGSTGLDVQDGFCIPMFGT